MSSGSETYRPRHIAGARKRQAPAASLIPVPVPAAGPDGDDAPVAEIKRSRFAFALAVTVAAVPIVVLDNLPATAAAERVESTATDDMALSATEAPGSAVVVDTTPPSTMAPTTTAAPATTTTAAPVTNAAPAVQARAAVAPTTTVAAPPPTTIVPTTTTTAPPSSASGPDPKDPATWDRLAQCESSGRWSLNTGNGYYGGLQFALASWQGVGGSGYPHEASRAEQIHRGQLLQARYGWGQWPSCSSQLGYR